MGDQQPGSTGRGRSFRRVDVTVWADADQVDRLGSQIRLLLCPDPDHVPPCPIPWEVDVHELDDDDPATENLRAQVAAENPD